MENEEVVSNDMNNFVGTTVMIECGEGSVLVGSPERTCQENGEYSGSENPTDCICELQTWTALKDYLSIPF